MFEWYKKAKECYVYLNEVHWVKNGTKDEVESSRRSFRDSKWFTRGWTLQELLAPSKALFFDKRWKFIGSREKLSTDISTATSIDASVVRDYSDRNNRQEISVAMKMAWVAKRERSRTEDMAYCMLGIFDVNMPLLYGERRKAFLRLQLEIIRKNDEESIFAWTADDIKDTKDTRYTEGASLGMLATWPSAFKGSGDVFVDPQKVNARPSYSMTNKGLEFPLKRERWERDHSLVLNCWRKRVDHGKELAFPIVIWLCQFGRYERRIRCSALILADSPGSISRSLYEKRWETVYVKQDDL